MSTRVFAWGAIPAWPPARTGTAWRRKYPKNQAHRDRSGAESVRLKRGIIPMSESCMSPFRVCIAESRPAWRYVRWMRSASVQRMELWLWTEPGVSVVTPVPMPVRLAFPSTEKTVRCKNATTAWTASGKDRSQRAWRAARQLHCVPERWMNCPDWPVKRRRAGLLLPQIHPCGLANNRKK